MCSSSAGECGPNSNTSNESDVTSEREVITKVAFCDQKQGWIASGGHCIQSGSEQPAADTPACGNPTSTASGCKQETITLHHLRSGSRSIPVELRYGNQFHLVGGKLLGEPSWFLEPADRRLHLDLLSAALPRVVSAGGSGATQEFHAKPDGSFTSFDPQISLARTTVQGSVWMRTDYRAQTLELFDSAGRLQQLRYLAGGGFDMAYADAQTLLPQSITSVTGQKIALTYNSTKRLTSIQLPNQQVITLGYQDYADADKNIADTYLQQITYPDATNIRFDYTPGMTVPKWLSSNSLSSEGKQTWHLLPNEGGGGNEARIEPQEMGRAFFNLSKKIDQTGGTYADFQYDDAGRVTVSQHAGGTFLHRFAYQPTQTQVTQPLGLTTTFAFAVINGQRHLDRVVTQRPDVPGGISTIIYNYDTRGNITQQIDTGLNNGGDTQVRCFKIDPASNRPAVALEGLRQCPPDADTYVLGPEARKSTIQWSPDTRLPIRISAPGAITTWVYHGQPDPSAGNATASCAPANAVLPNGKPLALVCKAIIQATTDTNGSLGFAAPAQASAPARTATWTYNQWGQVLTADGARTDVPDRTTYTYHASGAAAGELQSITNAAGHATRFTRYDPHGNLLQAIDPNGAVTNIAYDARQRPTSITTAGEKTSFTYDSLGQLVRTTEPDGSYLQNTYDAAHRLIATADHLGNQISYTLDGAGNRTGEHIKDPSGTLRRQVKRQFDALGRLQNTTGAP